MEPASVTSVASVSLDTTQQGARPGASGSQTKLDWRAHSGALRYGAAVLLVAVAEILRRVLSQFSGGTAATYIAFYPAILVAAVLGGLGPGILATLLSAAAAVHSFPEPHELGVRAASEVAGLAIFVFTGTGISALAGILDRTRSRAEGKLRGASLYSRGLFEAAINPLMSIGPDGRITEVNKATEEATGVARSGLIGTEFASYFTEPEKARAGFREVFGRGRIAEYALAIRHVSGRVTEGIYNAVLYRDDSGSVVGAVAAARDVTRRMRAEQELAAYHLHLEELVAQRTAEIQTSNTRLENAYEELETFAYSVSHDLRAPLRAVDGFSRVLLEEYGVKLDAEGQRIVGVIRDGTRRMAQLIDDILAFSHAGRQAIAPGAVDMDNLVRAALKDLEPALAGCDVKLEIQPLPASYGDAPMIRLLWTNLLDNAIKFTRAKNAGVIEVGGQAGEKETVYYVKDNGAGFDMQYVSKLFGVFQRLHAQNEFPGTGIGLAIVKRIVARHGGRVWAEGKVDQGATIYFALPNGGTT